MTLHRWHEQETAVCDVLEESSVTSRLASVREGQESLAVNEGRNVVPRVVGQDNGGALLGHLGLPRARGVHRRLRRKVRPL